MRRAVKTTILTAAAALLLAAAPADDAKKDLDGLQGIWNVESLVRGGKFASPAVVSKMQLVISGDKATMKAPKLDDAVGTFKLDPLQKPAAIDLVRDDKQVLLGIYSLDGDTLRLALQKPGGKDRPTTFESPEDSEVNVFVLKREKK
jgi:uncharacterized protein (TIGR03067 family)